MLMVPSARGFVGAVPKPWPYFVAASQPTVYSTAANVTIPVPANAASGDCLIAILYLQSYGSQGLTAPSGWALLIGGSGSFAAYINYSWDGITTPIFGNEYVSILAATGALCAYRHFSTVQPPFEIWSGTETPATTSASPSFGAGESYGPNRTFINMWLSLTPQAPSSLTNGVFRSDSFTNSDGNLVTRVINAQTDNATYMACFGVADFSPLAGTPSAVNIYPGGTLNYGNPTGGEGASSQDGFLLALTMMPPGGVAGGPT